MTLSTIIELMNIEESGNNNGEGKGETEDTRQERSGCLAWTARDIAF